MAKPRNSVLYLFDPLQQSPSTPHRDSSPELGASDKENDVPPGDVTMFFNRTFCSQKSQEAQAQRPHTPNGKLIDIGDTPAPDRLWAGTEDDRAHDGSDADEEQSECEVENASIVLQSAAPRTPLAELSVEDTPRPQQGSRWPSQAPVFSPPKTTADDEGPLRALFAAPAPLGSPLAEVINSINLSALNVSENATPTAEHPPSLGTEDADVQDGRPPSPFPEITVCAPETPSMPEFDLGHEEEPVASPTTNGSTLRPPASLTQLSPDDPRRTSVDLYSSFHLQMQSAEMSFDLLNDKISFLGNGQDSFWAGGEDGMFEFDEEHHASKAQKHRTAEQIQAREFEHVFTPPAGDAQVIEMPMVRSPTETAMMVPLPMSPPPSTPSPRVTPPRAPQQAVVDEPPSPPTTPISLDEPSLLLESEPLPPQMPPPVPALRIVKKTFKLTGRKSVAPATATRAEKQEAAGKKPSPVPTKAAPAPAPAPIAAPQPQHPRPNFRGVQRPPPGMLAAGVVIGLPPQGSSHNTSASTSSSSSAGSSASRAARTQDNAAAARYAAAGVQRPTLPTANNRARPTGSAPMRPTKAPAATTGITRTSSASAAVAARASASAAGALRPPSRIAAPGANAGAGSALPRPAASRLPGVSGLARHASTGGLARPRVVTAPRAPTGGRF